MAFNWLTTLYIFGGCLGFITFWHFYRAVNVPKITLKKANVLITGGSQGIGYETAKSCIEQGSNVIIVARNETILKKSTEELCKYKIDKSQQILYVVADVSNFNALQQQIKETLKNNKWDTLDVLICNAGVECVELFDKCEISTHHQIMNINYFGAVNTIKICLPYLKKTNNNNNNNNNNNTISRIIVNSSMFGLLGLMYYSSYCASKYALRGLVDVLSIELLPFNIYTCIIYPPDVQTESYKREKAVEIPQEVRNISSEAGLWSPKDIGRDICKIIQNGQYSYAWGLDGNLIKNLTVGMNPPTSYIESVIQCFFLGILRIIAMWYPKNWRNVSKNYLYK